MEERELGNTPSRFPRSRNWESSENWWSTPRLSRRSMENFCLCSIPTWWMGSFPPWCSFTIQRITASPFSDYQLMPTLEEYSRLIGIPVYVQDPYSGLEKNPDDIIIAAT